MKNLFGRLFSKTGATNSRPIVIVSGLPRSGTSLMMKMLEAGGIPPLLDGIREADADNPKGYYEFERVKKLDKGDVAWLADAQGKVVKVISSLLMYLPTEYTYRVVFMQRSLDEVLASQQKMLHRRGETDSTQDVDDAELAQLFRSHVNETKRWLASQPNIATAYVNYNELLREPAKEAARIQGLIGTELLGGALNVDAMIKMIDPKLYRNRV